MKVDALMLELRPRSMTEASDLGVRMVQAHAASIWRCFVPVHLALTALALSTMDAAAWLPGLLIFWLKPWADRTLLFVLSRAVFGQRTTWADLWRERRAVWWQRLHVTLTLRRLSPWRSYTQAVDQLEGQRGAALRARCRTMLGGQQGRAAGMQLVFANLEFVLCVGLLALAAWLSLPGEEVVSMSWLTGGSASARYLAAGVYAAAVLFIEPFYVGAGFGMYLNRRVQLEAWDVEQEFRRAFG